MRAHSLFAVGAAILVASAPAARSETRATAGHSAPRIEIAQAATTDNSAEKQAFEAAKELGTVDAWDAFLANYPTGFHADLARAYVKKLAGAAPASAAGAPSASAPAAAVVTVANVTEVSYNEGTFFQRGPKSWFEQRSNGTPEIRYSETGRSDLGVELVDESGNVFITLDLAGRTVWRKEGSAPPKKLRDITSASGNPAAANAPPSANAAAAFKDNSCETMKYVRSKNSDTPASITFINDTGVHRSLYWIDFNGTGRPYGNIDPGQEVTQKTFLTHPWMIADGAGTCYRVVLPERGKSIVRLSRREITSPAPDSDDEPRTAKPKRTAPPEPKKCSKNETLVNGKCVWKQTKKGFEIAPWKKPGCGTWQSQCKQGNAQACAKYETTCQVN
ncbi:MAG: hypothetical protein WC807_13925 [Hyphomicrobium sp.]|jgi:hypothetical protein